MPTNIAFRSIDQLDHYIQTVDSMLIFNCNGIVLGKSVNNTVVLEAYHPLTGLPLQRSILTSQNFPLDSWLLLSLNRDAVGKIQFNIVFYRSNNYVHNYILFKNGCSFILPYEIPVPIQNSEDVKIPRSCDGEKFVSVFKPYLNEVAHASYLYELNFNKSLLYFTYHTLKNIYRAQGRLTINDGIILRFRKSMEDVIDLMRDRHIYVKSSMEVPNLTLHAGDMLTTTDFDLFVILS
jgi:hypothetical protein